MNPLKTLNRYRMQALLADLAVVLLGIGTIFVFFQARNWVIPSLILLLLFYALIAAPMEKRYTSHSFSVPRPSVYSRGWW